MARTLYAKLAIVLAGLFTLVGVFFLLLLMLATERFQQEVTQKLNRDLAGQIVAERLLLDSAHIDQEALDQIFHTMMVINPQLELYLLDPHGQILAYSAPPGRVRRTQIDLEPVKKFLAQESALPIVGDDPRAFDRHKIFSAAPIRHDGRLQGFLYVILGGETYESMADMLEGSYVLRLIAGLGVAGLVFALFAATLMFALLTRRLRRLSAAVTAFKETGVLRPLRGNAAGDELDRLSAAFEDLAGRVKAQMEKLRQDDTLRRELVANVSHDLRTPLASLHGYLETLLLKDGDLSDSERRRYIEVALKHSARLGHLVFELFELAKLDANEVQPHREPFSLPELVQDVVQKFELRAEQRGVRLEHRLERRAVPFVIGDIGLLERVLSNLLENALRHTPRGGCVTVALVPADDRVTVRVSDTGHGIAERDLPHIFDRFYKPTTQGDNGGAGLGLAIARRILELHGSVIRATSELNVGTSFTFDLPAQDRRDENVRFA